MTFLEWLHMEYLEPEANDNYHEKDMVAAWNQAVAVCLHIVKKNDVSPAAYKILKEIDSVYWRGEDNGH